MKIAVLFGGPSAEHEVSLASGKNVIESLDKKKYKVIPVKIDKNGLWHVVSGPGLREKQALKKLKELCVDVVFIALHGEYGEDGTVQRLLEKAKIKFTGSGSRASRIGMDKIISAKLFKTAGLLTAAFTPQFDDRQTGGSKAVVVKPVDRGSSVGTTVVFCPTKKRIAVAIRKARRFSKRVMIQKYIAGRELTCGVLGNQALPPTEIIPKKSRFFDYKAKYQTGASDEITPARLPRKKIKQIQNAALAAHRAIGAKGFSRVDFILGSNGALYVLEINTIPGLTKNSLIPKQARAAGMTFPEFLDRVITLTFAR